MWLLFKNLFRHKIRTKRLFAKQYDKHGHFQAYDTCVRYGFAREFLACGETPDGFWYKMYVKMQTRRGTISDHGPARFIALIKSYVANQYSGQKIVLYKRGGVVLADGSHRLALNLLFGYKWIYYVRNNHKCRFRNYGLDWFVNNGFTQDEIERLIQLKEEIFTKYKLTKKVD